jgi:hypothetical protein
MIVPAKHKVGDKIQVLIARTWHPAEVVNVHWWNHASGSSYPCYRVRFFDGSGEMSCGNNSTRTARRN